MKISVPVATVLTCLSAVMASAALAPGAFDEAVEQLSRATAKEPRERGLDTDPAGLRVLLSSVDMTIYLIDAYGQCRDKGNAHEACMALIRETLDHARGLLGR
ncbi:MAG TPA: hypothetical protein VIY27_06985 [Myxococcota bacterium]